MCGTGGCVLFVGLTGDLARLASSADGKVITSNLTVGGCRVPYQLVGQARRHTSRFMLTYLPSRASDFRYDRPTCLGKAFVMATLWRNFARDEAGIILSAELVLILTIAVLGMVVGLVNVQQGILGEFTDLSMAFQSLNQSYATPSYRGCMKFWGRTSWVAGSSFIDIFDGCIGSGPGYVNGDIVGSSNYYLPAQPQQIIEEPHVVVPATGDVCPPATGVGNSPGLIPVPSVSPDYSLPSSTGSCTTCP